MVTRSITPSINSTVTLDTKRAVPQVQLSVWRMVALASLAVGVSSGWRVMHQQSALGPSIAVAFIMTLVTFAGWYVWGYLVHLIDNAFLGRTAEPQETLDAFGRAYIFQALFLLTLTNPGGWLWGWIAFYCTVVAWGFIGPRCLGMRTWQAIAAAAIGVVVWVACLAVLTLTLTVNGIYPGVGPFLL